MSQIQNSPTTTKWGKYKLGTDPPTTNSVNSDDSKNTTNDDDDQVFSAHSQVQVQVQVPTTVESFLAAMCGNSLTIDQKIELIVTVKNQFIFQQAAKLLTEDDVSRLVNNTNGITVLRTIAAIGIESFVCFIGSLTSSSRTALYTTYTAAAVPVQNFGKLKLLLDALYLTLSTSQFRILKLAVPDLFGLLLPLQMLPCVPTPIYPNCPSPTLGTNPSTNPSTNGGSSSILYPLVPVPTMPLFSPESTRLLESVLFNRYLEHLESTGDVAFPLFLLFPPAANSSDPDLLRLFLLQSLISKTRNHCCKK